MILERIRLLRDQRGIALPLAMMVLALLAGLTAAFVAMAGMEPFIATNHRASSQALALAEAGLERSIWALDAPSSPRSFNIIGMAAGDPMPNPVPAPYDGSQLITLGTGGGYTMNICAPNAVTCPPTSPDPRDRNLRAVGFVMREGVAVPAAPGAIQADDRTAQKTVTAVLAYIGPPQPPGALTVAGSVDVTGNSTVDGNDSAPGVPNASKTCNTKGRAGITIRDKTTLQDGSTINNTITSGGSSQTAGSDLQGTQLPLPGTQSVDAQTFSQYLFSDAQLAALKNYAQQLAGKTPPEAQIITPTSNGQINLSVTDGLVFVDTVGGAPLCTKTFPDQPCGAPGNPVNTNVLANVKITGASNKGWIVIMGSLSIDGNVTYDGLVYAVNDIVYRGTGTGHIEGSVISANVVDTKSTVVDTQALGQAKIYYDCDKVKNGGGKFTPPQGYFVKGGTWRETSN